MEPTLCIPLKFMLQELSNYRCQMLILYTQLYNMFNTPIQSKDVHTKCGIIHSLFNFLFGTSSSLEETNAIKNSMEILKGNQDNLCDQIKQTFNFVNLNYVESNMNGLLFS